MFPISGSKHAGGALPPRRAPQPHPRRFVLLRREHQGEQLLRERAAAPVLLPETAGRQAGTGRDGRWGLGGGRNDHNP